MATGADLLLGASRCAGCGRRAGALCPRCRRSLEPPVDVPIPGVGRVVAPWRYEAAARSLILGLKLRGRRDLAVPLAEAMAAEVEKVGIQATALTWVPGRRAEAARRGFDHAHLLAVELGRRLGLPVVPLLARTRPAIDQTTLGARDRARNLRGAFTSSPAPLSIGLVDDLVTTGATASSCAAALGAAGAGRIEVVVPARADPTR